MNATTHVPVLFDETLAALAPGSSDVVLDCTFGRGGHARGLLNVMGPAGRLFALDRDPQAVSSGQQLQLSDQRFAIRHAPFSELRESLAEWAIDKVDVVLFDLGVSSPQLDEAERGFSFMRDGPLDMRMDPSVGVPASQWLQEIAEQDLMRVLKDLGEERFARRIARAIVLRRAESAFQTTNDLAAVIINAMPRIDHKKHPATRSFQAIRLALNSELEELRSGLSDAVQSLADGGRLAVISFHSLEDRIVKHFLREQHLGPEVPRGLPPPPDWPIPPLAKVAKPQRAGAAELSDNPRARSATLRSATRRISKTSV